jgi:hypothetical protein
VSKSQVLHKISLSGRNGIKRTEIRKEFQDIPIDEEVESLQKNGEIVMEKRGAACYLWEAENYLQYVLTTDTKFKILYTLIEEIKVLLERDPKQTTLTALPATIEHTFHHTDAGTSHIYGQDHRIAIDKEKFRRDFRLALRQNSGSSGWVSLSKIREQMDKMYSIERDHFYTLVQEIANKEYETYELSSGGTEGITVRGLLHGFIRCI